MKYIKNTPQKKTDQSVLRQYITFPLNSDTSRPVSLSQARYERTVLPTRPYCSKFTVLRRYSRNTFCRIVSVVCGVQHQETIRSAMDSTAFLLRSASSFISAAGET